jgi:hypothetical protein
MLRWAVPAGGWRTAPLAAVVCLALLCTASPARAADAFNAPGFGIILGGGNGELDAVVRKAGFTSRRLEDGGRSGALTLLAESYQDGVPFELVDTSLRKQDVHLEYQALYVELKRYFPLWSNLHTFWGLRGGATRITGTVERGAGKKDEAFQDNQVAPLWFLAVPLALENPGFLLLGLVEGGSVGLAWDLIPRHLWLEAQVSAAMVPGHRDKFIAVDIPFVVTRTVSISAAF